MSEWMQKAIDNGTPEFRAYAEYVAESMPDVTIAVLRDMFRHNASVREYTAHQARVENRKKIKARRTARKVTR